MNARPSVIHLRRLADGEPPGPVLDELLAALGGLEGRVGPGDLVLLKPNFVAPFARATTALDVIDHVVREVRRTGAVPVLAESSGFEFDTRATFRVLGVDAFARARQLELVDLDRGRFTDLALGDGLPTVPVAALAFEARLILNLPVLKGHTVTRVTGAVKNLFGLVGREGRRYLHSHSLERSIAALARRLPHALHVVDARRRLQRAVFSEATPLGYALAGEDPFALDHLGARLIGVDPAAVGHLRGVTAYELRGDQPAALPALSRQDSVRQRLHRALYSAFYWVDHAKHRLLGGESIIYDLHWYLGVHPVLRTLSPEQARAVAASCPVGAIDADSRRILRRACRPVRCLACHREHPALVRLGGLNSPESLR